MSARSSQRASRLKRIVRIGDSLASMAESAAAVRRRALSSEQDRLETVQRYLGDYGVLVEKREAGVQSAGSLRMYRDFSGWLTGLSEQQRSEVAQAEFLLEAALEEARSKRGFADAIEKVSERATRAAMQERAVEEQKTLDGLSQRRRRTGVGIQVAELTASQSDRQ
jgi:flagellar export protein FliJ